jgi:hypothetical protein
MSRITIVSPARIGIAALCLSGCFQMVHFNPDPPRVVKLPSLPPDGQVVAQSKVGTEYGTATVQTGTDCVSGTNNCVEHYQNVKTSSQHTYTEWDINGDKSLDLAQLRVGGDDRIDAETARYKEVVHPCNRGRVGLAIGVGFVTGSDPNPGTGGDTAGLIISGLGGVRRRDQALVLRAR